MEFLAGGSLSQRLAGRGRSEPAEAAAWGAALAGALETAHRSGIVHRDVKPQNVLSSDYGIPKLVDFGIARMRNAYETRTGFVSATLAHAAPEVLAGAAVSASADVYSLASVLFTMLAGHSPFERRSDDSLASLIARIATASPPDLREVGVPADLVDVVERGLAKEPDQRFESAAAFGFALRDVARSLGRTDADVPLGDAAQVAEAAAAIATEPSTPLHLALTVPRDREVQTLSDDDPLPTPSRRWPSVVVASLIAACVAGGVGVALTQRGGGGTHADPRTSTPIGLPAASIAAGEACEGFVCRFTVDSPPELPAGARWVWTINGATQSEAGPTLNYTFTTDGKQEIEVASTLGAERGAVSTRAVRLRTWRPVVRLTTHKHTVDVTAASDGSECLPATAQLQKRTTTAGWEPEGASFSLSAGGRKTLAVGPGDTYRVVLAGHPVGYGVCEAVSSPATYVAPLPSVSPSTPTTQPTTPTTRPSPHPSQPSHHHTLPPTPHLRSHARLAAHPSHSEMRTP